MSNGNWFERQDNKGAANPFPHDYLFPNLQLPDLSYSLVLRQSLEHVETSANGFSEIQPEIIDVDFAAFVLSTPHEAGAAHVRVQQLPTALVVSCSCAVPKTKLCVHQAQVLLNLLNRRHLRLFFDAPLRHEKIRAVAKDYGLQHEPNLDALFQLSYKGSFVEITPREKEIFPVTPAITAQLQEQILPKPERYSSLTTATDQAASKLMVVLGKHRYYDQFTVELFQAPFTKEGKPKNPFTPVKPLDLVWLLESPEELKFFSGIARFQNNYDGGNPEQDFAGLQALVRNPQGLDFYIHNTQASEKVNAASVVPVQVQRLKTDLQLTVHRQQSFYEISGELVIDGKAHALHQLYLKYQYFVHVGNTLYLPDQPDTLRVIDFFRKNSNRLLIHTSKYAEFQESILANLEQNIQITYSYLKPATKSQLAEQGFDQRREKILYLSETASYVYLLPVMRYGGELEIPVLSKKQLYATDSKGKAFSISRDSELELQLVSEIMRQHPDFEGQLPRLDFYLHKERFLDESWFLDAFEEWRKQDITILGFNDLKGNRRNSHKATVTLSVHSGINWFDTNLDIRFGKQKAKLKELHKAVKNKTRYVALDDGTQGILPQEWLEKLSRYFRYGEAVEDSIRTPKTNFSDVEELYEEEVLTQPVKEEIAKFRAKFSKFEEITPVEVPSGLNTTLRPYQHQGLNWLNFLDEFNFGGCLADDMGLGKTVQVIALLLLQRQKLGQNTNLVVVPTSLLFNWQAEVQKFAPSLRMYTLHGAQRTKEKPDFHDYDIVLTTYGTLLTEARRLKEFPFNYIVLDESQAIKNPESQRYKAARLLQSRNKLVLTGTPLENNTYDLYGQLSFACPGLLGSKQHFKDIYSMPIDKFDDFRKAQQLQKKISPFILRRTKQQVAPELPEKTEMVIYCEMPPEQRAVYDAYEKELRDYLEGKSDDELAKQGMHVLTGLTKLRQLCNSPALLPDAEGFDHPSAKIETLLEQIENKSRQHKILVFSQFVSMLDLIKPELQARGICFEYLTGQTRNRAARVENFQNNPNVRVFLISLKAGGVGLNLTAADYVYLVDPWWNPAAENQAIDRSHRIGQQKPVVAVRLICPDTVEEKILQLQATKKELASDLIKTDSAILKSLSKKDLLGLFR
ncbi:DEAD/DEAH box helicase [Rufibacter roseus]|uniref:DEAD/DEAH box helicase n=1 Tax=Rufibacter roseus TaxID=1567108 RepID=A0ABW2DKV3_9BACT|nr:DEAD/DEAH box helicase [Rufibacter roseus]